MNVYSYFERINDDAWPVIDLWHRTWLDNGWEPKLLREGDYLKWPGAAEFDRDVMKLPTVNNPRYERACYRRWALMAFIGGGWMTDYDVMNFGLRPELAPEICHPMMFLDPCSPCVVVGPASEYAAVSILFGQYKPDERDLENGRPHVSDMHITNRMFFDRAWNRTTLLCTEYGERAYQEMPLVHFSSRACPNKVKDIQEERNRRGQA